MPDKINIDEIVTPEWLRSQFIITRAKVKDVSDASGINRSQISSYRGGRAMSSTAKAFFYFYFEAFHLKRIINNIKDHEQKNRNIRKKN